jgi:hypothetical protein
VRQPLVGLPFVGLSLHLRNVITAAEVRSLARVTLANFGAVLFVSLIVTTPSMIAVARCQDLTWEMGVAERARPVLRFGLSGVIFLAVIVAGVLLLLPFTALTGSVLVAAIAVLLLSLCATPGTCWSPSERSLWEANMTRAEPRDRLVGSAIFVLRSAFYALTIRIWVSDSTFPSRSLMRQRRLTISLSPDTQSAVSR